MLSRLHFANSQAYHDIYNNKNRWDKEARLYKSFNEDRSSFGFLTYAEAKNRKDVLSRSFSRSAIEGVEDLCVEETHDLCAAFERQSMNKGKGGSGVDLHFAFRCMAMDMIITLCFGKNIHAVDAPDFKSPIVVAMDASSPVFLRFKYSGLYKNMILKCPPKLSRILIPITAGLVDLQQVCPNLCHKRRISIDTCIVTQSTNHFPHQRSRKAETPPAQQHSLPPPHGCRSLS